MPMSNGSASNGSGIGYPEHAPAHAHDAAAFRTRFQRSLVAPSPFRSVDPHTTPNTPSSTISATASNASGPPSDLSDLVQARGEAEGVVGRLEGLGGR